jgi:sterol desaturase/sphingolipid hydroxylase (fatty acid hydroxylase superfamily)
MSLLELTKIHVLFAELFMLTTGYYFIRSVFVAGAASVLLEKSRHAKHKRIYQITIDRSQILRELGSNVIIILYDALVAATLIYFNLFHSASESLRVFLFTFVLLFVWVEIWFYFSHRLVHHRSLFFIHAQHHEAKVTNPLTALSFSLMERTLLLIGVLIIPAALSYRIPLSFGAFAFYFTFNYALNVFGHLNVEFIHPRWIKHPLARILNTTTYHALHHARYRGHFGLFTPYLDEIFGTGFTDYLDVQREAYEGRGLLRIGQRLEPSMKQENSL